MITWLLVAVVAALPVGTRLFVHSFIPGVHEYEALFVYGSDSLVLILLLIGWRRHHAAIKSHLHSHGGALLFVLLIAGATAMIAAPSSWLAAYFIFRLALLIAFAYVVGILTSEKKVLQMVFATVAIVAVVESGIALSQFALQGSVGLQRFGEPQLLTVAGSTSTVAADGGRLLRAYGTFPHPNILAAFLVLGLLALSYWYLWCEQEIWSVIPKPRDLQQGHSVRRWTSREYLKILNQYLQHKYFLLRMAVAAAMFVVVLALALTFSRAGWIAAGVGIVSFAFAYLHHRPGGIVRLLLMIAACVAAVFLLFASAIGPRAQLQAGQPAVDMRLAYADIGLKIASQEFTGVGGGNQVLYGVEHRLYQQQGLRHAWDWEPVHNLYLMIAVEFGWLGLLSFLVFLGMVTFRLVKQPRTLEIVCVLGMLMAVATAGLFDHYLWDLQPGRLMLWLVIGLALSQLTHKES